MRNNRCLTYLALSDSLLDLFDLDFAKAFDLEEGLACCSMNGLMVSVYILCQSVEDLEGGSHSNGVVTVGFELRDVCCSYTCLG